MSLNKMKPNDIGVEDCLCPLCGNDRQVCIQDVLRDVEERMPGIYRISQCEHCDFVFLSRRPSASELAKCYGAAYHVLASYRSRGFSGWLYNIRYRLRCRSIRKYLSTGHKEILEAGCGNAGFLIALEKYLNNRCDLTGIDCSLAGVMLPGGSKIRLIEGDAFGMPLEAKYDVILLYDVLEHLPDPVGSLRRIHGLLKLGGVLIGQVPNWDSSWRRLFPRHWAGLQVPRHMNYFTETTIRAILNQTGFVCGRIGNVFDPGDLSVSLCNYFADRLQTTTKPRAFKIYVPLALAAAPIVAIRNLIMKSGEISFVAKRR